MAIDGTLVPYPVLGNGAGNSQVAESTLVTTAAKCELQIN